MKATAETQIQPPEPSEVQIRNGTPYQVTAEMELEEIRGDILDLALDLAYSVPFSKSANGTKGVTLDFRGQPTARRFYLSFPLKPKKMT